jgi:hypothetical protein
MASKFSVRWENYSDDTGRLILDINGRKYRGMGISVKDFQHFKQLLNRNRGQAIKFLEKEYGLERVPEENDGRASDESFNQLIDYLENLDREKTNDFEGGVGDKADPKSIDREELTEGIKDEMHDHGVNPKQALDIVMDEEQLEPGRYTKED